MRVAVLDLGTGNVHSLAKALAVVGATVDVTPDPSRALAADALVLPGVGAFGPAARRVSAWRDPLRERMAGGHPVLGICLGMQLLFEASEEAPGDGLGLFEGRVRRLCAARTPQMGWNTVASEPDPLWSEAADPVVYYANRYVAPGAAGGTVIGWSEYGGDRFPAAVRRERTWGTQFHPEKSGPGGLAILAAFLRAAGGSR